MPFPIFITPILLYDFPPEATHSGRETFGDSLLQIARQKGMPPSSRFSDPEKKWAD